LKRGLFVAVALLVLAALAYLLINKPWISKPVAAPMATSNATSSPGAAPTAFNPPPHSIAVLPFVNMSGDKEQEYFSDGLTEEILNSLARINELQVSARTSAFSFKGEKVDLGTIARKLNVGAILEGSVRRSARTVRVTAQLDNAITGFRLWSQTYDRNLGDVLELQTEIATAVASALKVSLLGDAAAKVELGGTRDPGAFDAYLRGLRAERTDPDDMQTVIAAQTEAIRLDSKYALAFAARSLALSRYGDYFAPTRASSRDAFDKALADARTAIAVAPELSEAHAALAEVLQKAFFEFGRAKEEYEHAVTLAPGNATTLARYGYFVAAMGDAETGIAAAKRAVALDPLNAASYEKLGDTLVNARRFADALAAYHQALTLDPHLALAIGGSGLMYYALGDLQSARSTCAVSPDFWLSQMCLSVAYHKLGQHADAEAMLTKLRAASGDGVVYQYAQIYAQWGNRPKAVEELEKAVRLRDPGTHLLKTDFLLDPLRNEPRFQAIERKLKFPD
jgi:TolB-like protein/Flp pilus assembly protein TadD